MLAGVVDDVHRPHPAALVGDPVVPVVDDVPAEDRDRRAGAGAEIASGPGEQRPCRSSGQPTSSRPCQRRPDGGHGRRTVYSLPERGLLPSRAGRTGPDAAGGSRPRDRRPRDGPGLGERTVGPAAQHVAHRRGRRERDRGTEQALAVPADRGGHRVEQPLGDVRGDQAAEAHRQAGHRVGELVVGRLASPAGAGLARSQANSAPIAAMYAGMASTVRSSFTPLPSHLSHQRHGVGRAEPERPGLREVGDGCRPGPPSDLVTGDEAAAAPARLDLARLLSSRYARATVLTATPSSPASPLTVGSRSPARSSPVSTCATTCDRICSYGGAAAPASTLITPPVWQRPPPLVRPRWSNPSRPRKRRLGLHPRRSSLSRPPQRCGTSRQAR